MLSCHLETHMMCPMSQHVKNNVDVNNIISAPSKEFRARARVNRKKIWHISAEWFLRYTSRQTERNRYPHHNTSHHYQVSALWFYVYRCVLCINPAFIAVNLILTWSELSRKTGSWCLGATFSGWSLTSCRTANRSPRSTCCTRLPGSNVWMSGDLLPWSSSSSLRSQSSPCRPSGRLSTGTAHGNVLSPKRRFSNGNWEHARLNMHLVVSCFIRQCNALATGVSVTINYCW